MSGYFDRRSLTIALDAPFFPFDPDYLLEPRRFPNPAVRVYVHETLHLWQVLSQGFIANLALDEWRDLLAFERDGTLPDVDSLARRFVRPHPDLGFSAWNLSEALARYWDIHIVGPLRLFQERRGMVPDLEVSGYTNAVFDSLMLEEDAYAEPYRLALKRWGSNSAVILFPLVGHFALQTPKPVEVFAEVIDRAVDLFRLEERRFSIHEVWREVFVDVYRLCCEACFSICELVALTPGWDVIRKSVLADHPVFGHYLALLAAVLPDWQERAHFYFALPGDPEARARLASTFRAPVTLLHGGRWTGETGVTKLLSLRDWPPDSIMARLLPPDVLADTATDIFERGKKLRQAVALQRLLGRRQ